MSLRTIILTIRFSAIIFLLFTGYLPLFSQEAAKDTKTGEDNLAQFADKGTQDIDFYSLEDLLNVEIEVASLFAEDELVVGSTVSSISPKQWKMRGARRLTDAIENETSVVNYSVNGGFKTTQMRGYSRDAIVTKGVATMIDGMPIVSLTNGTNDGMPNWGLGTLNGIEIIKGPGSSIYGSDAFHGVIALKTFESEKDQYSVEAAGAYPLYADGNFKISQGLGDMLRVNASASYNQQIASEKAEYEYDTKEKPADIPPYPLDALRYEQEEEKGTGEYENKYTTATGVLKLAIKPAEKLKIGLGGYAVYNNFENFSGTKESISLQLNDRDYSSQESSLYIGRGNIEYTLFKNISVEARGYYYYWKNVFQITTNPNGQYTELDIDENRSGFDLIIKQPDNAVNLQWLVALSRTKINVPSAEIGYYDKDGNVFDVTGGLFTEILDPALPFNDKSRTINSAYAQAKWGMINKALYLLAGGRVDDYSDAGTQFTPRGGLIYLPTEKSAVKALYGRAFMAPTASALYGVTFFSVGDEEIKPETIDIYELILMYKEKKYKASLNGFYSNWENGIVLEPNTRGGFESYIYTNSGENRAYGGEFNLNYQIDPAALDFGFSYVKSTALKSDNIDKDRDYETFPEYSVICGINYFIKQIEVNVYLNNRVYLNMKETANTTEKDHLPPYWRMDLNISKIINEKLEMFLDVRNLLNRKNEMPSLYYPSLGNTYPQYENTGVNGGIPDPGISVLLRAGYKL